MQCHPKRVNVKEAVQKDGNLSSMVEYVMQTAQEIKEIEETCLKTVRHSSRMDWGDGALREEHCGHATTA